MLQNVLSNSECNILLNLVGIVIVGFNSIIKMVNS